MLTSLHIQDFVLIDELSLTLSQGLTALTGETGAGKSILLDALGLACGGRAERGAVRRGAKQGVVTVVFEPPSNHAVWALLEENGLIGEMDGEESQIILRRVQGSDGRGRGFINDRPVSVSMLRQIGECLMEIHGQHDGRGFLTASTHRELLDDFGGHEVQVKKVRACWRDWRESVSALDEKKRDRDQALREADYLRHVVSELIEIDPQEDEEGDLVETRTRLMAAEKMLDEVRSARESIDDDGLEERFSRAARQLASASGRLTEGDSLFDEASEKIEAALSHIMEARAVTAQLADKLDPDPQALEQVEERLFALRGAARKHGVTLQNLPAFFLRAKTTLESLDAGEAAFEDLEKAVREGETRYMREAERLSKKRTKIAAILDKAVMTELAPLKLGRAHFTTSIETDKTNPGSDGIDHIEFMVATNPGAPMGPLKTIASGGELSRFILAMKAALSARENRTVIIFDEVDAGVGGAVAEAVGERLARLAHNTQVLVVTHSPQVAACADAHWQVSKKQSAKETTTDVVVLSDGERIEEIARLLSGAKVTTEARAAAGKLLGVTVKPGPRAKAGVKSTARQKKAG